MGATEANVWRARPALAALVQGVVLAVPLLVSLVAVLVALRLQEPGAARTWQGLAVLLVVALAVSVVIERLLRRFLPVAVLLRLTMVFPDRAPSRLRMLRTVARQAPPRQLHWTGGGAAPLDTAEQVLRLVGALTAHDRRTRGHSERVRVFTELLAEELDLEPGARERLRWVALLHDIGKLGVAPRVLNKPGPLDGPEFTAVKEHPASGAAHAEPLMPWLGEWGLGILDHHERYDGSGYPSGKAGEEISEAGRLLAVVDAFETMTSARPYSKAVGTRAARTELARCAGAHFDPTYVRAFLAISLPRVLWAMGPLAFAVQLPFVRTLAEAGARTSSVSPQTALATGAAGAAALLTGGASLSGPALADETGSSRGGAAVSAAETPSGNGDRTQGTERRWNPTFGIRPGKAPAPPQAPAPFAAEAEAGAAPPPPAPAPAGAGPAPAPVQPQAPHRAAVPPRTQQPTATAGPVTGDGVTILAGPPARTTSSTATFRLRSDDGDQLQCMTTRAGQVGSGADPGVRPCGSTITYRDLEPGTYTFRVRSGGGQWLDWTWEVLPAGP